MGDSPGLHIVAGDKVHLKTFNHQQDIQEKFRIFSVGARRALIASYTLKQT